MKVAFLSPAGELGGAERVLLSMIEALHDVAEIHLITLANGPLVSIAQRWGAVVHHIEMPEELANLGDSGSAVGKSNARLDSHSIGLGRLAWRCTRTVPKVWKVVQRLRDTITKTEPDVIHSNGNKTHMLAGFIGTQRAPIIWHLHDFVGQRRITPRVLRFVSRVPRKAIAVSHAVADDASKVLKSEKIDVIYNTVDTERLCPGASESGHLDVLAGMPVPPDTVIRVGLVGTFANWKGQDVLLHAIARLAERQPLGRFRFFIIGGPIYRTSNSQFSLRHLRELAEQLGITNRVGFIDFQEDVTDIYRGLDIVVHASTKPEPFGLTIVEAMACGRPVIVSQAGGAAELFSDQYDALGVPPGDVDALATAIDLLASDTGLRQRLACNARHTAVTRFSQDRLRSALTSLYAGLNPAVAPVSS